MLVLGQFDMRSTNGDQRSAKLGVVIYTSVVIPSACQVARGKDIEHEGSQRLNYLPCLPLISFAAHLPFLHSTPLRSE